MTPHRNPPPLAPAEPAAPRPPGRPRYVDFAPPSIGDEEIAEVAAALRSGWITTGPRAQRFEEEFAARVGAPAALALNSCSAGLHAALHVSGIGPGDAVVTTPLTFAATAHAIGHTGASVVLADVEPDTLNLSPSAAAAALDRAARDGLRPRAIVPVHYAGHPCDLDAFASLAEERGLVLVEDAAHALPSERDGRPVGARAARSGVRSFASFSFHATKNVTTGDGGMLTGPPDALAAARTFCHQGIAREPGSAPWRYDVVDAGSKYGMTDVAAALGLVQLRKLPAAAARRRAVAERYLAAFRDSAALELPVEREGCRTSWHLFVVRLRLETLRIDRDRFVDELHARGIGASVHFRPLHVQSWFRRRLGHAPGDFPVAWSAWPRLLSLPVHAGLTDADADAVAGAVLDVCRTWRR